MASKELDARIHTNQEHETNTKVRLVLKMTALSPWHAALIKSDGRLAIKKSGCGAKKASRTRANLLTNHYGFTEALAFGLVAVAGAEVVAGEVD